MATNRLAYIGRRVCGCIDAIVIEDKHQPSLVLDALADMRRQGLQISQISADEADRRGLERCKRHRSAEMTASW